MSYGRPTLAQAVQAARNLNEPGEENSEYVRGQANLIADLYGPLDAETMTGLLTEVITSRRDLVWFFSSLCERLCELAEAR